MKPQQQRLNPDITTVCVRVKTLQFVQAEQTVRVVKVAVVYAETSHVVQQRHAGTCCTHVCYFCCRP